MSAPSTASSVAAISARGRWAVLVAAFLGWLFSGFPFAAASLVGMNATEEFLARQRLDSVQLFRARNLLGAHEYPRETAPARIKVIKSTWFAWYNAALMFGAACGGFVFGACGDRYGRVATMGASILCYSAFGVLGGLVQTPEQFLATRFFCGLGVGGMWPTGVSLAAEAWAGMSRPWLSGLLGASANVGIAWINGLGTQYDVTADSWRWVPAWSLLSLPLVAFVWFCVPESPLWLEDRRRRLAVGPGEGKPAARPSNFQVFLPPLLLRTLIGIALGSIPLIGGWGVTQWVIPWAESVSPLEPRSKAWAALMRSVGGTIGSLFGGMLAQWLGRRTTYFLVSLSSLASCEFLYSALHPTDAAFLPWVFISGLITTIFFGWLPLYLPELFPTHARAAGAGVSFNFGRILTGLGVLLTGALTAFFGGEIAKAGQVMSLIYGLGMIVILFAPDTTRESAGGLERGTPPEGRTREGG